MNNKVISLENDVIIKINDVKNKINILSKLLIDKTNELKYVKKSTSVIGITKGISLITVVLLFIVVCIDIKPILFVLSLFSLTSVGLVCFRVSNNIMKKYKNLGITNKRQLKEMILKLGDNINNIEKLINNYESIIKNYDDVLNEIKSINIDFVNNLNNEYNDVILMEKIYRKQK